MNLSDISRQYSSASYRIANQDKVTAGEVALDSDTGHINLRTTTGWLQIGTAGAPHSVVVDSIAGPRGASAGGTIAISGSSQQTAVISETLVDVSCDTVCYLAIGAAPVAALNTSYRLTANTTYRFPIVSGDKLAVIGTTGNFWFSPVL